MTRVTALVRALLKKGWIELRAYGSLDLNSLRKLSQKKTKLFCDVVIKKVLQRKKGKWLFKLTPLVRLKA